MSSAVVPQSKAVLEDKHISWLVMDYLIERRCFEALISLQLELGFAHKHFAPEPLFAYMLIIQGRLGDALLVLKPVQKKLLSKFDKSLFSIYKQKYLESLCWQGGGGGRHALLPWRPGSDVNDEGAEEDEKKQEEMIQSLKNLENYCSSEDFEELVKLLTLYKLSDHPAYKLWTVSRGRIECASEIANYLQELYPTDPNPAPSEHVQPKDVDASSIIQLLSAGLRSQLNGKEVNHSTFNTHWNEEMRTISVSNNHAKNISNVQVTNFELKNKLVAKSAFHIYEDSLSASTSGNIFSTKPLSNPVIPVSIDSNINNDRGVNGSASSNKIIKNDGINENSIAGDRQIENIFEFASAAVPGSGSGSSGQTSRTKPPESWVIDISGGNSNSSKEGVESGLDKFQNRSKTLASKVPKDRKDSINYTAAGSPSNKRDAIKSSHSIRPPSSPSFGGNNVNSVDSKFTFSPSSNRVAHTSNKNKGIDDFQNQAPLHSVLSDYTNPVHEQNPGATASGPSKLKHLTLFQHHTPIRCASVIPNIGPYHNRELGSGEAVFALGTNSKSVHILHANINDIQRSNEVSTSNLQLVTSFNDAHSGSVYTMDYSPDTGALVTGSNDKSIRILNIANKVTSAPLVSHTGTVRVVKYRPTQLDNSINNPSNHYAWNNTSILASGGAGDFCTRIWDVNHESFSSKLTPNISAIHALSWINNYSIISGCEKGMVIVNDIRDVNNSAWASDLKQLLDSSKNNFNSKMVDNISKNLAIYSMCSNIDSQVVHLGCSDGYVCSVDLRTKLLCGIEKLHNDDVRSVLSYSSIPQRHNICTSSYDTTAHIFSSVLTSARQLEFQKIYSMTGGHSDKILSTAIFNFEKHSVLSTGADGKAILWF